MLGNYEATCIVTIKMVTMLIIVIFLEAIASLVVGMSVTHSVSQNTLANIQVKQVKQDTLSSTNVKNIKDIIK